MKLRYSAAKEAFQYGQYQKSMEEINIILENKSISYDSSIILKANCFIANAIRNSTFNFAECESINSMIYGIGNEELRNSTICQFNQNISLFLASKGDYKSAIRQLELSCSHDNTNKSYEMLCSLILLERGKLPKQVSPFIHLWSSYLRRKHDTVLQISGEFEQTKYIHYLKGFSYLLQRNYQHAIPFFFTSISNHYRITDSYNCIGICYFYLHQVQNSLINFEKGIRSSLANVNSIVFNMAEVVGSIGNFNEQTILLQFYCRLEHSQHDGSLLTLYKLAKISLLNKEYHNAVDQYQYIYDESLSNGIDLPSSTFLCEFAYSLNMIGDSKTAQKIFKLPKDSTDFEKCVSAHSHWLNYEYNQCFELIKNINTPEAFINKASLHYINGNFKDAFTLGNRARQEAPNDLEIVRNAVLIHLSREQNLRSGCSIWLTAKHYTLDRNEQYYGDLLEVLSNAGADQLTLCVLKNWKEIIHQRAVKK